MMTRKIVFGMILAFVAGGFYGCTNYKRVEGTGAKSGKTMTVKKSAGQYTVQKGDSLWNIARSKYGDSFQWPLIFKANRDLVEDPDIIEPAQKISVQKGFSQAEIERARELASKTPKYVPHSQPRKTLPLNYF